METGIYHHDMLLEKAFQDNSKELYNLLVIDGEEHQITLLDFYFNCLSLHIFFMIIEIYIIIYEFMTSFR